MKRRFVVVGVAGIVACSQSAIVVGDDTGQQATPTDTQSTDPTPNNGGDDNKPTPLFDASFDATPDPNGDSGPIKVGPPDSGAGSDAASNPDGGPIACTAAGGTCVGLAPGSCPGNNFGDATKYSCGGGLGVACCLP